MNTIRRTLRGPLCDIAALATILALFVTLALALAMPADAGLFLKHQAMHPENGVVRIAVSDVDDGRAHYYFTKIHGKEIRYFVIMSPDEVIRAAFDACDVCFESGKGYSQNNDFMVCNNCGQTFHSSRINVVKGGCNPAPLDRTTKDDTVLINVEDIASGARFF